MIDKKELEKFISTYSIARLESFVYGENDTIDDIKIRYNQNVKISQALYPELCTLEIILRNAINTALINKISKTWLEDEIKNNTLLKEEDYKLLLSAYEIAKKECKSNKKPLTTGKIIANLNFGFWTNLCMKKYSASIWNKKQCFKSVFVNYPNKRPEISIISKKLYAIRKLRNRIFHYEQIFRHPNKTLELYNMIIEILSYLPSDEFQVLKNNSSFLNIYNEIMKLEVNI
ncbi:Abi family protein [bacterium]|nr:Abi family protein [bacterium]MBQ9149474.1 Abi family protein [bacterium]